MRFFLFFLASLPLFAASPPSASILGPQETDPKTIHMGCVDVFRGAYVESSCDLTVAGLEPLHLSRVHMSSHPWRGSVDDAWEMNEPRLMLGIVCSNREVVTYGCRWENPRGGVQSYRPKSRPRCILASGQRCRSIAEMGRRSTTSLGRSRVKGGSDGRAVLVRLMSL